MNYLTFENVMSSKSERGGATRKCPVLPGMTSGGDRAARPVPARRA